MLNSTIYQSYSGAGDAFLPLYFIVCIIFTIAVNLTLLVTLFKESILDPNGFLKIMCYINLLSGISALPMTLAMAAWRELSQIEIFCNMLGALTHVLHRASMLNLSAVNFERYFCIANPLRFRYSERTKVTKFLKAVLILFPALISALSFAFSTCPYGPLSHSPLCIILPRKSNLSVLGYVDVAMMFFMPLCIILSVSVGILKISCKMSHTLVYPIQVLPADTCIAEGIKVRTTVLDNKIRKHQRQLSVRKRKIRNRTQRIPLSPTNNLKALITISTTLCVFTVLNAPLASVVVILSSSFTARSTRSTEQPVLEYLSCVAMFATYVVYPLLNGLTSREIRLKMLRMVRNKLSVKIIDMNELDEPSMAQWKHRDADFSTNRKTASATLGNVKRHHFTEYPLLPSTVERNEVARFFLRQSMIHVETVARTASAPSRKLHVFCHEMQSIKPCKVPAALLPHSISCPVPRKLFKPCPPMEFTKSSESHSSEAATTLHYTTPYTKTHTTKAGSTSGLPYGLPRQTILPGAPS